MARERDGALEVRALYPLPELAIVANVSADRLRRLLRASGVEMLRSGRNLLVPLSEIERKIPPLWESIKAIEMVRHGPSS